MSGVLATLLEMWFTHKCIYKTALAATKNRDNQPIVTYSDPAPLPLCRLQDLTAEEISTLTEDGVQNAAAKLLVPPDKNLALGSQVFDVYTNGRGVDELEDVPVDLRIYEVVRNYMRRSTIDEYRQLILRRIG